MTSGAKKLGTKHRIELQTTCQNHITRQPYSLRGEKKGADRLFKMTQSQDNTLTAIRQYATESRELQAVQMDFDASGTEARLEQTVKELQARVREQQVALEEVRKQPHSQNMH